MRRNLAKEEGARKRFTAVFSRTGKKINFNGFSEDTLLLTDVRDAETNSRVTDHIWFAYSKVFDKLNLQPGMKIAFDARIKQYKKGYKNRKLGISDHAVDYKLSHPTKVVILS
jgi:hypothetical protein